MTVSVAALLVAALWPLQSSTASNRAPVSPVAAMTLYVAEVAPVTAANVTPPSLLRCHCTSSVPLLQVPPTVKVALEPAATDTSAGCGVIVRTGAAAVTVKVASLLLALPATLVATASNTAPLSVIAVVATL